MKVTSSNLIPLLTVFPMIIITIGQVITTSNDVLIRLYIHMERLILGNLKFVPKGESVEVFGMAIPDPLITEAIQQSSYYPKYLKMVAKNTKKTPQESTSMQPATKRATPKKPTITTPVKQSKPAHSPTKKPFKQGNDPDTLERAKKIECGKHFKKRRQGEEMI
ncbi:hypothetical protein Tco_0289417 [Tanacetum coccineum]